MAIVNRGQSFLDIVLQQTGRIDNVFETALLNGMSITDDLVIGTEVKKAGVVNKTIVSIFNSKNKPASAIDLEVVAFGGAFNSGFSYGFNI